MPCRPGQGFSRLLTCTRTAGGQTCDTSSSSRHDKISPEGTEKRSDRTVRILFKQEDAALTCFAVSGPHSEKPGHTVQWQHGVELPPFVQSFTLTLNGVLNGSIVPSPIKITNGMAIQLYILMFQLKPQSLEATTWRHYCSLLGTFAVGQPFLPSPLEMKRLQMLLAREGSPVGLWPRFREQVRKRERDSEMAAMDYEQATTHLLKRWDLLPFIFDFGVAAGGGGDPGGGSSDLRRSLLRPLPLSLS